MFKWKSKKKGHCMQVGEGLMVQRKVGRLSKNGRKKGSLVATHSLEQQK